MNFKVLGFVSAAALASLATAVPASAEIVFLASGRTLSVKNHKIDGESIVLTLRSGGQVTCDKALISKIEPDVVPYPEPPPVAEPVSAVDEEQQDRTLLAGTPYGEIIASVSLLHGVDPMLVRALIQVESGYQPKARSRKGAMGLMQLMPSTAREYKVRNPFEPKANIEAGIKHLKGLTERLPLALALAAYNAGEAAVARFHGIPPYPETQAYVGRILKLLAQ